MKDISPTLAIFVLLANTVSLSVACSSGAPTAPAPMVEATPSTIDPDDSDAIPCGPRRVLQSICQRCHTKPPANGAPFPLVTRSNIVRVGPDGEIRQLMIEQIEAGRMPLAPVTIDYDSRETLLDWLRAGAPAVTPRSCEETDANDAGSRPDSSATTAGRDD